MKCACISALCPLAFSLFAVTALSAEPVPDPRHLSNGWPIPSEGYADQPYLVKTDDGAWLCAVTTGPGKEGASGQHVVSMRSTDQGRTWSAPVAIEPSEGPESAYAVLLKVPGGRIYAFYNHNTDNVREVKREDKGVYKRVDSLGHYVFKYSDDHGRTWSAKRYDVPVRAFECDRNNVYGGTLRFFWNVGRPLLLEDAALLVLHKVCACGQGFFSQSEGCFLRSGNILNERDPEKIVFETLPDGGDWAARTGGWRAHRRGAERRLAERRVTVLRVSDGGRLACLRLQPRRRPHVDIAGLCGLHARRTAIQASAGGELCLEMRQRQVPVLVSQSRRGGRGGEVSGRRRELSL